MQSKQKLVEIYHLAKCPFTFQELPETSVPNSIKASLEGKSLDLPGTTSAQQEKRWIGDSEGRHCLCVCFCCLQRRLFPFFFFFFCSAICTTARKARIVRTCKPLVNDHCVEALMTIPFELPTLLFFHGLKSYAKENKSIMDILWLHHHVKGNCSCVLLVMVNGGVLAGLSKEQGATNWAESWSWPCYADIDGLRSRHVWRRKGSHYLIQRLSWEHF